MYLSADKSDRDSKFIDTLLHSSRSVMMSLQRKVEMTFSAEEAAGPRQGGSKGRSVGRKTLMVSITNYESSRRTEEKQRDINRT